MTTSTDVLMLAGLVVGLVVLGGVAVLTRARWTTILTPGEWRVFVKLLAIVVFWFLLVITHIATELSGEMFIYGRF